METIVIGCVACHIDSSVALKRFQRCVKSIASQTRPVDYFVVSWSATTEALKRECVDYLSTIVRNHSSWYFCNWNQNLQQFQHYQMICCRILWLFASLFRMDIDAAAFASMMKNVYLIFGDADDEWLPRRAEDMLGVKHRDYKDGDIIVFLYYLKSEEGVNDITETSYAVDDGSRKFEYFSAFLPFLTFRDFFRQCNAYYLESSWCDLAFDSYLEKQPTLIIEFQSEDMTEYDYLYWKRGSSSVMYGITNTAEKKVAKLVERHLMENFPNPLTSGQILSAANEYEDTLTVLKEIDIHVFQHVFKPVTADMFQYINCNTSTIPPASIQPT
jgi:hypothetical protein